MEKASDRDRTDDRLVEFSFSTYQNMSLSLCAFLLVFSMKATQKEMKATQKEILDQRYRGLTVNQIAKNVGRSKSTVSYTLKKYFPSHLHAALTKKNNDEVSSKRIGEAARQGQQAYYARKRHEAKTCYLQKLEACDDINLIMYFAGFYAGEGGKTKNEFTVYNSNPIFITLSKRFFVEVLQLPPSRLVLELYIHKTMCPEVCKEQWKKYKLEPHKIRSVDDRKKTRADNRWEGKYYGTMRLRPKSPLGMRDALEEFVHKLLQM